MTTTKRTHSVHIQAPVPLVFKYIEDPQLTYPEMLGTQVIDVEPKPEGIGTTWTSVAPPMMGIYLSWHFTREDQVVDARIVDKSSTGVQFIWTLHPAPEDSTELTLEVDVSAPVLLDKIMMITVGRHADEDMAKELAVIKNAIES